jgi:hypothetical protein
VEEPEGIVDQRFPRKFLPLNKFFYGVKQVPRMRYLLLCSVFNSLGFAPLESEPSIYHNSRTQVTIPVYVDDSLVLSAKRTIDSGSLQWPRQILRYRKQRPSENVPQPQHHQNFNDLSNKSVRIHRSHALSLSYERRYVASAPLDPSLSHLKA